MPRPLVATINQAALRHNLACLSTAAGESSLLAVVKANAYGHGLSRIWPALQSSKGLALLDLNEAQQLRDWGFKGAILLLEGVFESRDLELCSRLHLTHVIHCAEQVDLLAVHKTHEPHRVFLKMNTGMNRLGFDSKTYRSAFLRLEALPQVGEIVHMTHLAAADTDETAVLAQLEKFEYVLEDLSGERSVANSAALLRYPDLADRWGDWVRPGIALYGSSPDAPIHSAADWDLQPVMTLKSEIIAVQNIAPGQSVGYGAGFTATRPMRIGIVACGYADGYPRHVSAQPPQSPPVLVNGVRTHLVGRVSMDMLAVDITDLPTACHGSEVVLWGVSALNQAYLSVDEIALAAGTIGYELLCALAPRVRVEVLT